MTVGFFLAEKPVCITSRKDSQLFFKMKYDWIPPDCRTKPGNTIQELPKES